MLSRSRGRCGDVDSPDIRMMRKLFDIVDTRPKCTALIALTRGFSRCSCSTGFSCQYYPKRKVFLIGVSFYIQIPHNGRVKKLGTRGGRSPPFHCCNTKALSPPSPFFILQIAGCFTGRFSEVKLVFPVTPRQSFRLINASLTSVVSVEPASLIASATSMKVS